MFQTGYSPQMTQVVDLLISLSIIVAPAAMGGRARSQPYCAAAPRCAKILVQQKLAVLILTETQGMSPYKFFVVILEVSSFA